MKPKYLEMQQKRIKENKHTHKTILGYKQKIDISCTKCVVHACLEKTIWEKKKENNNNKIYAEQLKNEEEEKEILLTQKTDIRET